MVAPTQLWDLYEEWKRLTLTEGAAINASNWIEVSRCQAAKQKLQPQIIRVTDAARAEAPEIGGCERINEEIRERVNELIQLETLNNASLQAQLARLERQRSELDKTTSRLKQIHRSYVPQTSPVWQHYS